MAEVVEVGEWVADGVAEALSLLVMAAQEEKEVQERQLWKEIVSAFEDMYLWMRRVREWTYGFPSLPSTTPLGIAFFSGAAGS